MSKAWFAYIGPVGSELDSSRYLLSTVKPTCFEGSANICAVYGTLQPEKYGLSPAPFSANLISYIPAAKITGSAQPTGIGSPKKYVYTFPGA